MKPKHHEHKKRLKLCLLALAALLICTGSFALRLHREQLQLAGGLIRLHVVANSDEPADQAEKLRVRDALLPVIAELTEGCESAAQAEAALRAGLPQLEQAAARALSSPSGDVRLSLGRESFPRRDYPTFSLPAGAYETLRVVLGAGEGRNWWCVAFPALCLSATTEELEQTARAAGFDESAQRLLTGEGESVELKFRILEWLRALF